MLLLKNCLQLMVFFPQNSFFYSHILVVLFNSIWSLACLSDSLDQQLSFWKFSPIKLLACSLYWGWPSKMRFVTKASDLTLSLLCNVQCSTLLFFLLLAFMLLNLLLVFSTIFKSVPSLIHLPCRMSIGYIYWNYDSKRHLFSVHSFSVLLKAINFL